MDILTQGLLGSAVAQLGAKKTQVKQATIIGFFSGLLADTDILFIRSSTDSLLSIEYHRHFTHSIFFIPLGALIACILLWPLFRKTLGFKRLYYYSFLGYLFSGTLDLFTSYGTYWLWPFLNERLALHVIGIVDLFFTLSLFTAVILCFIKNTPKIAGIGLIICISYLGIGYLQLLRATSVAEELIASRGHKAQRLLVKPSPLTLFLWRSIYEYENNYYMDAIHISWRQRVYEGDTAEKYIPKLELPNLESNTVLAHDIKRFTKFSDGYIASSPDNKLVIGDMRYALLPNSNKPLWGIEIDPNVQDKHAQYNFYRTNNKSDRNQFLRMMLGQDLR